MSSIFSQKSWGFIRFFARGFFCLKKPVEYDSETGGQQDHEDRRGRLPRVSLQQKADRAEQGEDRDGAQIRVQTAADCFQTEQGVQSHRERRGKNQCGDAGAHAAEKRLHARVFQQIADQRGDEQNDDKGGKHHAERSDQRAENAALRCADKGCHVHRDRSRRGFGHGDKAHELALGHPAV